MKPGRSRCSLYDPRSEEEDSTDENDRIEMFERTTGTNGYPIQNIDFHPSNFFALVSSNKQKYL
ncbi:Protein CBG06496 [Caenorhabditis briggsae]|uniref:Protein CBG06496 n=1 Tax=Caenorhabditis briggsae TaxID=6238 RepID=A8X2D1_CAEBR|nr:Protein CBG06496 [Caenorhabditis briggsae]CAP26791.2 Protein CBG06496 [Caenorhabditis briggsae]